MTSLSGAPLSVDVVQKQSASAGLATSSSNTAVLMATSVMASTHTGSIIWGGCRYIPHGGEDSDGRVGDVVNSSNVSNQPPPIVGSEEDSFLGVVNCDEEEMNPFDAESFVDRLVEDDPSPQFANGRARGDWIWEAPVAAELPRGMGEISNKHPPGDAKPYAQPIFFWADPEREARADGVKAEVCENKAVVVRNDPILGSLYTPAPIALPEVAPGDALKLIPETNHRDGRGFHYDEVEFEPVAMDNNSPGVGLLNPDSEVPWVPARPGCGGVCMTSPGPTTYADCSDGALDPVTSAAYVHATSSSITAAPPRLIVADGGEYDDEQHAFLRKQEVTRYVGPGYLVRPGKPGLVTPEQRASLVNLIVRVHAAAPAASGNATPLSVEALALAVNIFDRFLSTSDGGNVALSGWGEVKLASVACLGLASKYEDTQPSTLLGLAVVTASENDQVDGLRGDNLIGQGGVDDDVRVKRKKIVAMEKRVSSALGYRLTVPTGISFLGVFIHRACLLGYLPEGQAKEVVRNEAERILLHVLRESCSLSHLPSALAAAALYWASCTTPGIVSPSSFTFFSVTGYHLDSLYCCLRDVEIVRIASGAGGMGWGDE